MKTKHTLDARYPQLPCYIFAVSMTSTTCIFCQIIEGSAESSEVYRGDTCVAFLDVHPINAGHVLVCPTRHVGSFTDLKPEEIAAILAIAQHLARVQKDKLSNCLGVNLLLSDCEVAVREVPHVHFHVVPTGEGDGFEWRRSGTQAKREELDLIAEQLLDS